MTTFTEPKFPCGVLLATPGASEAFERNRQSILDFVKRHLLGDWGEELCDEDRASNDQSLLNGSRLLSAYRLKDHTKIWLITEAADERGRREATTALLPSEY